jgi:YVTN family beta-propeller protein
VLTTFAIGSEARAIDFDSNGKFVYIAARNIDRLAVVDARTHTLVQTIAVGLRPHGVAFDPGTARIYVVNRGTCASPGTVSVIESGTMAVVATVQVGICSRFVDRNPRTGLLYVPNSVSRSVSVIQDLTGSQ